MAGPHNLTPREREVLVLMAEGYSTKEIANELGISVSTVASHRGNIFAKLNVHDALDLLLYAIAHKLVES